MIGFGGDFGPRRETGGLVMQRKDFLRFIELCDLASRGELNAFDYAVFLSYKAYIDSGIEHKEHIEAKIERAIGDYMEKLKNSFGNV